MPLNEQQLEDRVKGIGLTELIHGDVVEPLWLLSDFKVCIVVRKDENEVELARPYATVEEHQNRPMLGYEPIIFNLSDTRDFRFKLLQRNEG